MTFFPGEEIALHFVFMGALHPLLQAVKDERLFVLQVSGKVGRVFESAPWETLRGT